MELSTTFITCILLVEGVHCAYASAVSEGDVSSSSWSIFSIGWNSLLLGLLLALAFVFVKNWQNESTRSVPIRQQPISFSHTSLNTPRKRASSNTRRKPSAANSGRRGSTVSFRESPSLSTSTAKSDRYTYDRMDGRSYEQGLTNGWPETGGRSYADYGRNADSRVSSHPHEGYSAWSENHANRTFSRSQLGSSPWSREKDDLSGTTDLSLLRAQTPQPYLPTYSGPSPTTNRYQLSVSNHGESNVDTGTHAMARRLDTPSNAANDIFNYDGFGDVEEQTESADSRPHASVRGSNRVESAAMPNPHSDSDTEAQSQKDDGNNNQVQDENLLNHHEWVLSQQTSSTKRKRSEDDAEPSKREALSRISDEENISRKRKKQIRQEIVEAFYEMYQEALSGSKRNREYSDDDSETEEEVDQPTTRSKRRTSSRDEKKKDKVDEQKRNLANTKSKRRRRHTSRPPPLTRDSGSASVMIPPSGQSGPPSNFSAASTQNSVFGFSKGEQEASTSNTSATQDTWTFSKRHSPDAGSTKKRRSGMDSHESTAGVSSSEGANKELKTFGDSLAPSGSLFAGGANDSVCRPNTSTSSLFEQSVPTASNVSWSGPSSSTFAHSQPTTDLPASNAQFGFSAKKPDADDSASKEASSSLTFSGGQSVFSDTNAVASTSSLPTTSSKESTENSASTWLGGGANLFTTSEEKPQQNAASESSSAAQNTFLGIGTLARNESSVDTKASSSFGFNTVGNTSFPAFSTGEKTDGSSSLFGSLTSKTDSGAQSAMTIFDATANTSSDENRFSSNNKSDPSQPTMFGGNQNVFGSASSGSKAGAGSTIDFQSGTNPLGTSNTGEMFGSTGQQKASSSSQSMFSGNFGQTNQSGSGSTPLNLFGHLGQQASNTSQNPFANGGHTNQASSSSSTSSQSIFGNAPANQPGHGSSTPSPAPFGNLAQTNQANSVFAPQTGMSQQNPPAAPSGFAAPGQQAQGQQAFTGLGNSNAGMFGQPATQNPMTGDQQAPGFMNNATPTMGVQQNANQLVGGQPPGRKKKLKAKKRGQ